MGPRRDCCGDCGSDVCVVWTNLQRSSRQRSSMQERTPFDARALRRMRGERSPSDARLLRSMRALQCFHCSGPVDPWAQGGGFIGHKIWCDPCWRWWQAHGCRWQLWDVFGCSSHVRTVCREVAAEEHVSWIIAAFCGHLPSVVLHLRR